MVMMIEHHSLLLNEQEGLEGAPLVQARQA